MIDLPVEIALDDIKVMREPHEFIIATHGMFRHERDAPHAVHKIDHTGKDRTKEHNPISLRSPLFLRLIV